MSTSFTPMIFIAVITSTTMLLAWMWQQKTRNAGIVDVVWSFGLSAAGIIVAVFGNGDLAVRILVAMIAGGWYARLGIHLCQRVMSESEDGRYQAMRRALGKYASFFHFFFFQFQALLVLIFALPMWVAANNSNSSPVLLLCAVLIAVAAFIGEGVADAQLAVFRENPANRGKTCRVGLWHYSRHPNYFFEWLQWFVWPLLAFGSPWAYWVWLAPLVMFLFIYYITGIPYTEQQALRSRGDDYRDYQRTTSAFIPWKPKRRKV